MQLQKVVKSNPKRSAVKKCVAPKNAVLKKKSEIQSDSQEMAVIG